MSYTHLDINLSRKLLSTNISRWIFNIHDIYCSDNDINPFITAHYAAINRTTVKGSLKIPFYGVIELNLSLMSRMDCQDLINDPTIVSIHIIDKLAGVYQNSSRLLYKTKTTECRVKCIKYMYYALLLRHIKQIKITTNY